ncbi:MAG: hypothetical protein ABI599_13390 [Flavobacteriales bacterium]
MLKVIARSLLFLLLTVITQIGGMVLLLSWLVSRRLLARWPVRFPKLLGTAVFVMLYITTTALIVPPLARLNGRVPLPVFEDEALAPRTLGTALLNRHYVDVELKTLAHDVAHAFAEKGRPPVLYLDACFPFFDGFPLLPHLSHNDGRKLDLAFCYKNAEGVPTVSTPSLIGYGAFAYPMANEENTSARCLADGAWWYDILGFVPTDHAIGLDEQRTKELVNTLADNQHTGKIFIEPYLKKRLGIESNKVRFHGCHAVSHADHIHVQLR